MPAPVRTVERPSEAPVQGSGGDVALELVTTREGFDALEADWNALFARAGRDTHLFQTFDWLWHWANHFLPGPGDTGPELAIVTGRIGGRLVMVWPLVRDRVGPITRLGWMGDPVSQYGDVLLDDLPDAPQALRAAWDFITRSTGAGVVTLRKVRADAVVAPLLSETGARVVTELKAPYLDLASAPSFADYEKRYSSNARRNRGRQRRRLADRGPLELKWHTSGADAAALAADAFALKRVWLRERGLLSPALSDPRTQRFFADVTRAETRPAGCYVIALICNGRPAAIEIGVRCKGRSAIHVIVYDLALEKTGAGSLLMEDSIRRAFGDGMAVFDMLAPADGYKLDWADDAVIVCDWAAPVSMLGRAYADLYLGHIRTGLKRGLDLLPVGLRRRLAGALSSPRRDAGA